MQSNSIVISIIVPLFNSKDHIAACIDSLLTQSYANFEVIVVDDGSTDGSYETVQRYAAKDSRITALKQQHSFAGSARNLGMEHAKGEYLLFLDSDDFFDSNLLARAYEQITSTDADICVFGANWLNDKTGETKPMLNACRPQLCPDAPTFNRHTNARNIFCFTTPAPWTKMFRRSFIEKHGLRFQETRSANDLRFVFSALALADRITAIDDRLVTYRRQNDSSLQSTQSKDPLAFYQALISLRDELKRFDVFEDVHHAFTNACLDMCMYNLRTLRSDADAQKRVFEHLRTAAFNELELAGKPRSYFYEYPASRYDDFLLVSYGTFEEYRRATAPADAATKPSLRQKLRNIIPLRASVYDRRRDKTDRQFKLLQYEMQQLAERNEQLERRIADLEGSVVGQNLS